MEPEPYLGAADTFYLRFFIAYQTFTGKTLLVFKIHYYTPVLISDQFGFSSADLSLACSADLFHSAYKERGNPSLPSICYTNVENFRPIFLKNGSFPLLKFYLCLFLNP